MIRFFNCVLGLQFKGYNEICADYCPVAGFFSETSIFGMAIYKCLKK